MKTLILCRHAKSDWPEGVPDAMRPLKDRGIKDARRQGQLLFERGVAVDLIFSSHANRALSTAKIIAEEIKYNGRIHEKPSIYHEGARGLITLAQELPDSIESAIFFGHNPTMEQVVRFLLQAEQPIAMPTCAMACFELSTSSWENLSPHTAQLRWLLIPRLKRKEDVS
ncbi:MAG: histidine phosphatase family protein [Bacteroidota bacterium]